MIRLYMRQGCPGCGKVRRFLENHRIPFEGIYVQKLGSERKELLALEGVEGPGVPLIVDEGKTIQGTDKILAHLADQGSYFGDPTYGLTRTLPGVTYADAIGKVTEALKVEGFGVLTEIDVKATLKKKLDADHRPYMILGACNPPFALKALTVEPAVGLLLPCNVVVTEDDEGNAVVSTIDPNKMLSIVGIPEMEPLAKEIFQKLRRALVSLG